MLKLVRRPGQKAWYIRGTVNGRRIDESTKVAEERLANQVRIKREHDLQLEAIHGASVTATFSQAALHYLEQGGSGRFLEPVLLHFSDKPLHQIQQADIDACARKLYPKATGSTRSRQVYGPISAVMHHAAALGWCQRPLIKRPRATSPAPRWLSKPEAERLIEACSPHMRRLVLFLLYTGARTGEALWLDWSNVDLERKHVQFVDTKNGTSRGVPLHSRVVQELSKTNDRTGCVFRTDTGDEYSRPTKQSDTSAGTRIKTAFKAGCRRAGITGFTPHGCRHTWATWHYIANRDLTALMRLGGWKTMSMVMRYSHVNTEELSGTIERL